MLNDTYTLGVAPDNLVHAKRFADAGKSVFAVAGLAANAARTLTVAHQPGKSGRVRSNLRLDETDVDPGSVTGATAVSSLYIVLDRASFKSEASAQSMRIRLKTLVDDSTFWAKFLNQEV